jgi:hypothetical protein
VTAVVVLLMAGLVYGISAGAHVVAGLAALALLALLLRSIANERRGAIH